MSEATLPTDQNADELTLAKLRLLSYSQQRVGPNVIQRHPALAAGVALLVGVAVVRFPVSRVLLRAGTILVLREAGKTIAKSVASRV